MEDAGQRAGQLQVPVRVQPGVTTLLALLALLAVLCNPTTVHALDNGLARTPPMGWNSWNHFHCGVTGPLMKNTADAIIAHGLDKLGYNMVATDDCWLQKQRNATGHLQPAITFGDVNQLSAYLHSKGLKFGIYGAAGLTTCASRAGSLYHEPIDAKTYAAWGVDYLKYDDCGEVNINSYAKFSAMRDALNATGRPVVLSYEPHLMVPISWPVEVGNLWRTGGDIGASYSRMLNEIELANGWATVTQPGAWGDCDMLEVGNKGLSIAEQRTHFALWCLIKSPLIIGADLTTIDPSSLAILSNAELIAINQDPLGAQARKVAAYPLPSRGKPRRPASFTVASPAPPAPPPPTPVPFVGGGYVTSCQYGRAITTAQGWSLKDNQIIVQGDRCLTRVGEGVSLAPCKAGDGADQHWLFYNGPDTVSQIGPAEAQRRRQPTAGNKQCLNFNGTALTLAPCQIEPTKCYSTRCATSALVEQLWYLSSQGQLISSFTNAYVPPLLDDDGNATFQSPPGLRKALDTASLINVPFCLATESNPHPPQPPTPPPSVDPSLPLHVWAGPLANGTVAVALLNTDDTYVTNVTAHWDTLGLPAGKTVHVRDTINHKDLGTATDSITATIQPHDVAVYKLTPAQQSN